MPGCPVEYVIYTTTGGVRTAIDAEKQRVISFTSTELVAASTPWDQQSATLTTFEAEVRVQSSEVSTFDLQVWNVNVVMASTLSTSAAKEASADFQL